jgi:hypothetical protein
MQDFVLVSNHNQNEIHWWKHQVEIKSTISPYAAHWSTPPPLEKLPPVTPWLPKPRRHLLRNSSSSLRWFRGRPRPAASIRSATGAPWIFLAPCFGWRSTGTTLHHPRTLWRPPYCHEPSPHRIPSTVATRPPSSSELLWCGAATQRDAFIAGR